MEIGNTVNKFFIGGYMSSTCPKCGVVNQNEINNMTCGDCKLVGKGKITFTFNKLLILMSVILIIHILNKIKKCI